MTETEHRTQLDERLQAIEAAAREIDVGDPSAALRIAWGLVAVFQPEGVAPTLLSRAGGTYVRLASCVPKPPHPQHLFVPLVNITLQMGVPGAGYVVQATTGPTGLAEPPRCAAPLGRTSSFRQVQAPDWWKSEPVMVIDHSKITRRDLTLWAVAGTGASAPTREGKPLEIRFAMNYGVTLEVPWPDALRAALRQIAHELHGSPELLKLAGQARR
jgi:hypothetical protein